MSLDIGPILEYWLEIADEMNVSIIKMHKKRVQIKAEIDNVIFCYFNPSGHPYGNRTSDDESYLTYLRSKWGKHPGFLESDDEIKLKQEIVSFFARALAYFKLCEFHASATDARHGIEIIQFVVKYCKNKQTAWSFEKLLPRWYFLYYLSLASISLRNGETAHAVRYLNKGSNIIHCCYTRMVRKGERIDGKEIRELNYFKKNILVSASWKDSPPLDHSLLGKVAFRKSNDKQKIDLDTIFDLDNN